MAPRRSPSLTPPTKPPSGEMKTTEESPANAAAVRSGRNTPKGKRERTHRRPQGDRRLFAEPCPNSAAHAAHRPVVAVAAHRRPGLRRLPDLRRGAGVSAEQLLRPRVPLPDSVLFTVYQQGLSTWGQPLLAPDPARRLVAS